MPKLKDRCPKKCRDRNQCFSWNNGKRIYHGVWGSPEADESYRRFKIALLESPTRPLRLDGESKVLVSELVFEYLDTIEKSQMHESHISHFKQAVGYLVEIYGGLEVCCGSCDERPLEAI